MSAAAAAPTMPMGSPLPSGPTASTARHQARVRFYRRMKRRRVYHMVVELTSAAGTLGNAATIDAVIARPLIPGALVVPAEQEISPRASNNRISFGVTPLAVGGLGDARLQLVHKGKVLDEIRTPMRGTSQRRTLVLALLTLLAFAYLVRLIGPLPNYSTGRWAENLLTFENIVMDFPSYNDYLPAGSPFVQANVAQQAQAAYNFIYDMPNLNFYVTIVLLVLTLLSALWNRPSWLRKRRSGKAIVLPALG